MPPSQLSVLIEICHALLLMRGEASAERLAQQVVRRYGLLDDRQRVEFFAALRDEFDADHDALDAAIDLYRNNPTPAAAQGVRLAAEAPRQVLMRAINNTPHGIQCLLNMRRHARAAAESDPELAPIEIDLSQLLASWFNRGFLHVEQIDWSTPASVLEKLIEYEAVHEIRGWDDLRRRLAGDRRCFGFFHPNLPGEPLIFIQVALTNGLMTSIHDVIDATPPSEEDDAHFDTAIFYSISNCQPGLAGIPLGNFLVKHVTEELAASEHELTNFATLSPVPGFIDWVRDTGGGLEPQVATAITSGPPLDHAVEAQVTSACARYLLSAKRGVEPLDSVARFHLRNGARLEQINWAGDTSVKGIAESYGMLVNYVYDLEEVADNHEAYMNDRRVAHSDHLRALAASSS